MTTRAQEVLLVGGPLDGETRMVDPARRVLTEPVDEYECERNYGDRIEHVTVTLIESYWRVDDSTFEHGRTPTALGDDEREFWKPDQEGA